MGIRPVTAWVNVASEAKAAVETAILGSPEVLLVGKTPLKAIDAEQWHIRSSRFPRSWQGREITAIVTTDAKTGDVDCVTWLLASDLGNLVGDDKLK
jgi:hypothetical protein